MFLSREALEESERARLAPYATLSAASRGRLHTEREPAYRTAFQRDRDRILHCAAFRRLEYKTQVFVNDEGDDYRTRLTHTLEVAQIGRTIARALAVNEDLVETICLAHDLGHPPFGHAGEDALDQVMRDHGGFNHNWQTYRIVTELESRYADFPGLNLTHETLAGIASHASTVDVACQVGIDAGRFGCLEAQIADFTDELAYNTHDLDDGLSSGIITTDDLDTLELWHRLRDGIGWRGGALSVIERHALIRQIVGVLVDDALHVTGKRLRDLAPQSPEEVTNAYVRIVGYSDSVGDQAAALKAFLYERMYHSPRVVRMQGRAQRFIARIFETLAADTRQLDPDAQAAVETRGVHRAVADVIASMTDRSALLEYQRLFDPLTRP